MYLRQDAVWAEYRPAATCQKNSEPVQGIQEGVCLDLSVDQTLGSYIS